MEDSVLEKIANKIAENYDSVKHYYYSKTNEEILSEAKNKTYEDSFIKDGTLYREVSFNKFSVTSILNYISNGYNFKNIVGIETDNGIKLYEKTYPNQIRARMIGIELHKIAENYASTLGDFSIEEPLSSNIDGDLVVGRLDLAKDNTIIDIKTGKLKEGIAKMQLSIYAFLYSKKYNLDSKINIAVVHKGGVLKDVVGRKEIKSYLSDLIKAKREMKKELKNGRFYIFKRI